MTRLTTADEIHDDERNQAKSRRRRRYAANAYVRQHPLSGPMASIKCAMWSKDEEDDGAGMRRWLLDVEDECGSLFRRRA